MEAAGMEQIFSLITFIATLVTGLVAAIVMAVLLVRYGKSHKETKRKYKAVERSDNAPQDQENKF